ncbi:hypothetical protein MBLNU457_5150t1 [Dothideomycetes sp. NU457]
MSPSKEHVRHLAWPTSFAFSESAPSDYTSKVSPVAVQAVESGGCDQATVLKEHASYTRPLPEIREDDDPFSHFLSPVLEEEDTFDESRYSAGIAPSESQSDAKKDYFFRARLEEKWETYVARRLLKHSSSTKTRLGSMPAPLPPPFPQSSTPAEDAMPDLIDSDISSPPSPESGVMQWGSPNTPTSDFDDSMIVNDSDSDADMIDDLDGWEGDRRRSTACDISLQSPTRRPRLNSLRTLSGKRHSWREPAWELYTLEEEDEEEQQKRQGRGRSDRKAKTVSWNEEVQVVEFDY